MTGTLGECSCSALALDRCRLGLLLGVLTLLFLSALKTAAPSLFFYRTITDTGVVTIEKSAWHCPGDLSPIECDALFEDTVGEAKLICGKYEASLVACQRRNGQRYCGNQIENLESCLQIAVTHLRSQRNLESVPDSIRP